VNNVSIKSELKQNPVILVSISSQKYSKAVLNIVKQLSKYSIRYVTLNKTKDSLLASFKESKLGEKDICFIDGITSTAIGNVKNTNKCVFLKAPNDLKQLELALARDKLEVIIVDSLSTFLIYESVETVTSFVKNLIKKLGQRKIVFISLEGEKENVLEKNLSKSVDKIIRLE